MIETFRKVTGDLGKGPPFTLRYEDHVRVGRQYPAVRRIGATHRDIARDWLKRHQPRLIFKALMDRWTYAQDPETFSRKGRKRILNSLWKCWIVVWGVVVDEQDLVVIIAQQLAHTVEAERRTF